jgi:hypothetical protein
MNRLAREAYRAGRCAFDEKNYNQAIELFKKSMGRKQNLKTLLWLVAARNPATFNLISKS